MFFKKFVTSSIALLIVSMITSLALAQAPKKKAGFSLFYTVSATALPSDPVNVSQADTAALNTIGIFTERRYLERRARLLNLENLPLGQTKGAKTE